MQESKLRLLVEHAYRKVPYYRTLLDDAGMKPGDIQTLKDLPRIPITTREALQQESTERRVDQTLDFAQFIDVETSGSSGQPLTVFITPGEARIRKGAHFRSLLDVGFRWNDHLLQLGFRVSRRAGMHERLGLYRADRIKSSVPPKGQYQRIRELNPSFIWSAPSSLQAVCDHAGRPMNEWMQPRVVITSAEMLHRNWLSASMTNWMPNDSTFTVRLRPAVSHVNVPHTRGST